MCEMDDPQLNSLGWQEAPNDSVVQMWTNRKRQALISLMFKPLLGLPLSCNKVVLFRGFLLAFHRGAGN